MATLVSEQQPVVLVSVDDYVTAVQVHADRVHDLVRRTGCGPAAAAEIVATSALDLLDVLLRDPESVGDLTGWWFSHAHDLARRVAATDAAADPAAVDDARGLLAGTELEAGVRETLAGLPERERTAILLRDGYDLPLATAAVALRRPDDVAASLIASARLHFVATYENRRAPSLDGHNGRQPVDAATLGRLADGSLPPTRAAALRRHVHTCPPCEEVAEAQTRARRLAAALPVLALDDDDRAALVDQAEDRARATLPSLEEVLLAADTHLDEAPLVPLRVVVAVVVLAAVLGALVGALTAVSSG